MNELHPEAHALDVYERHDSKAREIMRYAVEGVNLSMNPGIALAAAQVHATLALAAATRNNHPRCGVHCAALGC